MAKRRNYGRNRYLDFSSKIGEIEYEKAKHTPTEKQKKFYRDLVIRCNQNGIDKNMNYPVITRLDYAHAIDTLIGRLKEKGIETSGKRKNASGVLVIGEDKMGRLQTRERIEIEKEEEVE